LQGDILAPLLFIVILDYVLRSSVDKHPNLGFTLSERLSRRYPTIVQPTPHREFSSAAADAVGNNEDVLHFFDLKLWQVSESYD